MLTRSVCANWSVCTRPGVCVLTGVVCTNQECVLTGVCTNQDCVLTRSVYVLTCPKSSAYTD